MGNKFEYEKGIFGCWGMRGMGSVVEYERGCHGCWGMGLGLL